MLCHWNREILPSVEFRNEIEIYKISISYLTFISGDMINVKAALQSLFYFAFTTFEHKLKMGT